MALILLISDCLAALTAIGWPPGPEYSFATTSRRPSHCLPRKIAIAAFFVASANEGASLREVLPEARIYVFEGVLEGGEASLLEVNLIPVLNSLDQIRRWKAVGGGRTAVVHIDTGMSRLGLSAREGWEFF